MHRFYQPILPSSNLFLKHKWDFIDYETHRQKVKNIHSKIDQKAPRTYTHMYIKPKQLQLEVDRFYSIQRQNKYLMEKLEKIHRYGGWVDHDNTQHKPKSINTLARQKEAVRISNDNRTLHSRIKDEHTSYNRSHLEGSFAMQQKYRANIDKFPRQWREMSKDMKRFRADIREKYIYPKYGRPKSKKTGKTAQSGPLATELVPCDGKVEESEDPKLQMAILDRIRSIFAGKGDKTRVKIPEEDREESEDGKSEDEINQDEKKDEVNQDKKKDEVEHTEGKDEESQANKNEEVTQEQHNDEVKQTEENNEESQTNENDEITQDEHNDDVNEEKDEVEHAEETTEENSTKEKDEVAQDEHNDKEK